MDVRALFEAVRTGDEEVPSELRLEVTEVDDPDVARRWRSVEAERPRQVVTAYRPRVERPRSYPDELPFVPGVRVFLTEMEDRPGELGARWLVEDQSDVMADVLADMLASGWVEEPARELGFPFPGRRIVLRREGRARLLMEARLDEERRVVQLLALV